MELLSWAPQLAVTVRVDGHGPNGKSGSRGCISSDAEDYILAGLLARVSVEQQVRISALRDLFIDIRCRMFVAMDVCFGLEAVTSWRDKLNKYHE